MVQKPCWQRDMLYLPSGSARVHRLHAPFVTEKEIAAVVEFWKSQGAAEYQQQFLEAPRKSATLPALAQAAKIWRCEPQDDPLYQDAVRWWWSSARLPLPAAAALRVGYGRAAHLSI